MTPEGTGQKVEKGKEDEKSELYKGEKWNQE